MDETNNSNSTYYLKRDKVAEAIHLTRKHKKITLDELAEKTGFSKSYISRLERGERTLNLANLVKISDALGMDFKKFLSTNEDDVGKKNKKWGKDIFCELEFYHNGIEINIEQKLILSDIIEQILDSQWTKDTIVNEMSLVMGLVDKFKKL